MRKFTLIVCAMIAIGANAWDVVGHRIVSDIAYQNLTPEARAAVDKVLGFERAMVAMSSWADEIKSDTIYKGQSNWHFQDLDAGKTEKDLKYLLTHTEAEGKHLFWAKQSIINILKNDPNDADALKFIVHLCGDEFQPMHMGHHDDLGGNLRKFYWFGRNTNLHSLWDGALIEYTKYSSTEYAQYLVQRFAAQRDQYMAMDELALIVRTYNNPCAIYDHINALVADKDVQPDDRGSLRFKKGFEYRFTYVFRAVLDEQLYMAGIHLAQTLNNLYK